MTDRLTYATSKLSLCIRLAKDDVRDYRETKDIRYIGLRKEAMKMARYWKAQLAA